MTISNLKIMNVCAFPVLNLKPYKTYFCIYIYNMEQQQHYRYKKDDPEYIKNRKQHLINLTKEKYKNNEEFREKMKLTSKLYYQKLKEGFSR